MELRSVMTGLKKKNSLLLGNHLALDSVGGYICIMHNIQGPDLLFKIPASQ